MNINGFLSEISASSLRMRLLRGVAGTFWVTIFFKLAMLVSSILLARLMGASGYGVYATAMALVMLISVPTQLGLPNLIVRLMATYRENEQWQYMRGLLSLSTLAVTFTSIIVGVVGALAIYYSGVGGEENKAQVLWIAMCILPVLGVMTVLGASLRGLHYIVIGQIPEKVIMPSIFVIVLIAIWLFSESGKEVSASVAIGVRFFSTVVACLAVVVFIINRLPKSIRYAVPRFDFLVWLRSAFPLLIVGALTIVNTQTDVVMLSYYQSAEFAGVYQAAARISDLASFALVVINLAIQPTLSQLYTNKEMARFQRLVTLSSRSALGISIPIMVIMLFMAHPFMVILFGNEFGIGSSALLILVFAQVVNAGAGSVGVILNMTGYERDAALGLAIGVMINVSLNYLLIPKYGMEGAAIASFISVTSWNLLLAIFVYKRLKIWSPGLGVSFMRVHR